MVADVAGRHRTSTVWDDLFDNDDEAYAAFQQTFEEEGMGAFLDRANVIPFPRRH